MSLQWIGQDDFSVGTLVGLAQEQLPGVGVERAINAIFDDDGDIIRRGAVEREGLSSAPGPLTFTWSGVLANTYVELAATATHVYKVENNAFTQLAANGLARPVLAAIVGDRIFLPNGFVWDGTTVSTITWPPVLPPGTRHLGAAFDRLIVATGNVVAFSVAGNPTSFAATDYHKLPAGVVVQAIWTIRDLVLLFTNYGLYSISGMSFDLVDDFGNVQQTVSRLTPEISLLHEAGLADWAGTVVAPCVDRVFVIDGLSPPVPISDSIASMYMEHIRHGHLPGGAKVFRNHYFLPWIAGESHPVFVCRLNRPVRARQTYYPWSLWQGYPEGIAAFDVDLRAAPILRGVHGDGWRTDFTNCFPPFPDSEASISDPDASLPLFDVETRDYPTGNGQPNHVRRLRLFYYVVGKGEIQAGYSYGDISQRYQDLTTADGTYAELSASYANYEELRRGRDADPEWSDPIRYWHVFDPAGVPAPGVEPLLWNFATAERHRFIRARFRSTDGIAQIKIRQIQFGARPSTHER